MLVSTQITAKVYTTPTQINVALGISCSSLSPIHKLKAGPSAPWNVTLLGNRALVDAWCLFKMRSLCGDTADSVERGNVATDAQAEPATKRSYNTRVCLAG